MDSVLESIYLQNNMSNGTSNGTESQEAKKSSQYQLPKRSFVEDEQYGWNGQDYISQEEHHLGETYVSCEPSIEDGYNLQATPK
jgi:hypothetical protein